MTYWKEPDYRRDPLAIPASLEKRMREKIGELYGAASVASVYAEILRQMQVFHAHRAPATGPAEPVADAGEFFSEQDAILITYGDLIQSRDCPPLLSLSVLVRRYLRDVFNILHILPFFPYSSDRGFAVIDFKQVDPRLGTWDDIRGLAADFRLMFDGVFNHVSSRSPWFREFLAGNPDYSDFFTCFEDDAAVDEDIRKLFRPRTSDALTRFATLHGTKRVWTTFGPDQIDLKFQNPKVLTEMISVLLFYVRQGAQLLRLDAVTYLWDELGAGGVHLRQTHLIIQLFRDILDAVAPRVALVTETNVPHADNISYFGDGRNEAQMVYNFALPPLLLHTFQTTDTRRISEWAARLASPGPATTFLNFLDSHDGIGLPGARGILTESEIENLVRNVEAHQGFISNKKESDGSETAYELNITSYSAINKATESEAEDTQIRRYLAARSIAMALPGVPGVYLHALLGSRNDIEAVLRGEEKRNINRRNLDRDELFAALDQAQSPTARIADGIAAMLRVRRRHTAFHPAAPHRIVDMGRKIFAIERTARDGRERILCLCNVSGETLTVSAPEAGGRPLLDLLHNRPVAPAGNRPSLVLDPYAVMWLTDQP
jgi:glucosylglycerate phosphorylase